MEFYSLTVQNIQKLTAKSTKIDFSIPAELKNIFTWKAGQFLSFKFEIDNTPVVREYSVCTAPHEGFLSIAVKETARPFVSKYVQENVKIGDKLPVSAPLGNFGIPSRPNEKRTLAAFSAGSGITPVMSILKDTLHKEKDVNFYLFYGNADENDVMFKAELEEFRQKYPQNFHLYNFYSEQETDDNFFEGLLNEHKVELIINQIVDWDEVDEVLICGPKEMIVNLANAVYHNGIPKKHIHYELYEPIDQIFQNDEKEKSVVKEVEVTFTYEDENHTFTWKNNGSSLLEALLEKGFDVPYSCKGGV
ncbi:MAG: ferredoxin--NADP reductase, partial [Flavobacteriaceae bacterium]|nr:ferredoxin--NADP reductase [Flavobacteriaceae bacterium]